MDGASVQWKLNLLLSDSPVWQTDRQMDGAMGALHISYRALKSTWSTHSIPTVICQQCAYPCQQRLIVREWVQLQRSALFMGPGRQAPFNEWMDGWMDGQGFMAFSVRIDEINHGLVPTDCLPNYCKNCVMWPIPLLLGGGQRLEIITVDYIGSV